MARKLGNPVENFLRKFPKKFLKFPRFFFLEISNFYHFLKTFGLFVPVYRMTFSTNFYENSMQEGGARGDLHIVQVCELFFFCFSWHFFCSLEKHCGAHISIAFGASCKPAESLITQSVIFAVKIWISKEMSWCFFQSQLVDDGKNPRCVCSRAKADCTIASRKAGARRSSSLGDMLLRDASTSQAFQKFLAFQKFPPNFKSGNFPMIPMDVLQ